MEDFQYNPILLTLVFSLISLLSLNLIFHKPSTKTNPPPSPPKLPIIGNLHQLTSLPHRALHSLAKKHGPVMLLHFGSVPVLVVSSADSAREVMKTHDIAFASRPTFKASKKLLYNCKDVGSAPYGEYWRHIKSIFVLQLLNNKRVQSFPSAYTVGNKGYNYFSILLRIAALTACVVSAFRSASIPESPSDLRVCTLLSSSSRFSKDGETLTQISNLKREEETALLVNKVREASGAVDLSAMFATFTNDGIARAALGKKYSESENGKKFLCAMTDLMEFLGVINIGDFMPIERRNIHDFVDILIEICDDDASIQRDSIKPLLLDVFVGGTDTISTALEWVMSELLQNPRVMEKLQFEAVIKESMRCHPPFPLLGPRIAREDVRVKGYDVAAGTMVMINGWAIGRDPASWDESDKFIPERFLNSSIDLRGLDFELIPFGAGRRGCPGITFSIVAIEIVIANLVHKFDWKLPNGVDLDMNEIPGMAAHRVVPLLALASPISE
ncbi:unspecific monooxygenase [Salvia divinorum]|uniref:Unspecific monooxygenase n=1 Tax=Salvia divinorum TaxID=28513 RepID=A0ABD1HYD6_SALDI